LPPTTSPINLNPSGVACLHKIPIRAGHRKGGNLSALKSQILEVRTNFAIIVSAGTVYAAHRTNFVASFMQLTTRDVESSETNPEADSAKIRGNKNLLAEATFRKSFSALEGGDSENSASVVEFFLFFCLPLVGLQGGRRGEAFHHMKEVVRKG